MAAIINAMAKQYRMQISDPEFASKLDADDCLSSFRDKFCIPHQYKNKEKSCIYFCGHSLGPAPKTSIKSVTNEMEKWERRGVNGHFEEGENSICWTKMEQPCIDMMVPIVGAQTSSEVAILNMLTVNLHMLLIAFYRPSRTRFKIIVEDNLFCSDSHAIESQIRTRDLQVEETLIKVCVEPGKHTLNTAHILDIIEEQSDSLALVLLGGIQFMTGQLFDIERISNAAHLAGSLVGFDLAHAVGNVQLKLHDWNVDFACWCSYKYLCAGPGGIGGIFIHNKFDSHSLPRLEGWYGQDVSTRFEMASSHHGFVGARGFVLSTAPVWLIASLQSSLEIFSAAGMDRIFRKQLLLTGFLEALLLDDCFRNHLKIITPSDPSQRGSQLSIEFHQQLSSIHSELRHFGVCCDIRKNLMRIAPAPLFNSFRDVYDFIIILKKVLNNNN